MRRQRSILVGEILSQIVRDAGLEDGLMSVRAGEAYDKAVGQEIASYTLHKDFENGVLTCRISSSVVRTQLEFDKENIKGIINEIIGEDVVSAIRFL